MKLTPILATGLTLALAGTAGAETIRIGHATPEASPIHQALLFFEEELESRSDGEFEVEIFPGGQLGSVREMTDLVQSGNITMTTGASVHLSAAVDELAVLDQFLLFESEAEARSLLDGAAGDAIAAAMEERGLKNMGFMELGFRSFTNSRAPLDSYESFEGLRMRSADNPIAIAAWRSVGAVPVPLAWGEIYSSLQQGLIDGQESAPSSMIVERFFEVQDYVSLTGHIYWPELWMADLAWFEGLTPEQQALVEEVAAETVALQRDLTAEANAATIDELREAGLQVNELPAEDKARLGATMNAAIEADIRERVGDDFYEAFMAAVAR
jgi:tripartite ATP-independent transporter DctP family solute receptor